MSTHSSGEMNARSDDAAGLAKRKKCDKKSTLQSRHNGRDEMSLEMYRQHILIDNVIRSATSKITGDPVGRVIKMKAKADGQRINLNIAFCLRDRWRRRASSSQWLKNSEDFSLHFFFYYAEFFFLSPLCLAWVSFSHRQFTVESA